MNAKYDTIGKGYNYTRKADKYITERLYQNLRPDPEGLYLDIGCGTGNYTTSLQKRGLRFIGIDPSSHMLRKARERSPETDWRTGTADNTGLESNSLDGIIATLTIHHWPDPEAGFREMNRILKPGGTLVIFSSTPQQMRGYWLNHYFPKMMQDSLNQMPSLEEVTTALENAGFSPEGEEKYFVKPDLEDLFLYSGRHNPGIYLKPEVRKGISSFSDLSNLQETEHGLKNLEEGINTGKITEIIQSYENDLGDYLFICGRKKAAEE